jgi:uncharacterized protein (DUF305 family)
MRSGHYQLAAGAAALAAVALAACGSAATPAAPASSAPKAAATAPAAFNATDVAFTTGMLELQGQAVAVAGLVAGHTATPQLQQFAASVRAHEGDARRMRGLMGGWRRPAPAPYSPGAGRPAGMTGPGMMDARDWAEMSHLHGQAFGDRWLSAMISSYGAEVTLCQQEQGSGASPQARALATAMLAERQSELAQLRDWQHMGMMG